MAVSLYMMSVVAGAGCSVAPGGEELATVTDDIQRSEPSGERAVTVLPLRGEDLVDMTAMQAQLAAACPAPTTCAGFGACTNWSATTSCGTLVCGDSCLRRFGLPEDPIFITGIRRSTFSSRFRVCFDAQGQQCTEFQVFTQTTCQTMESGDCCSEAPPGTCGQVL